ncbi:hypothetical protein BJ508DRAFT_312855 [Ascobolus immersus RN42]|uniref:Uncharacterized protein n=1 Tax=Ascobolus immersus RN42 TaxID=1160509 RepID=A0A3N4HL26_ASCIM|nr:hypothetical protein BJ508DRAFT_312855 [Ascobolus immersus RN42]
MTVTEKLNLGEEHNSQPPHIPIAHKTESFWDGWNKTIDSSTPIGKLALIPRSEIKAIQSRVLVLHASAYLLNQIVSRTLFSESLSGTCPDASFWLTASDILNTFEIALRTVVPADLFSPWSFSWIDLTLVLDLATLGTWRLTRGTRPIRYFTGNAAKVQELEMICRTWGGAAKVLKAYEFLADAARVQREFWFLRGRDGAEEEVYVGEPGAVVTGEMVLGVLGPMREWCEKWGFGKRCWGEVRVDGEEETNGDGEEQTKGAEGLDAM